MTEEEVVNVGGEEIAEKSEDHHKIKGDHCNGDAHGKEKNDNGNVGDGVEVVADSGASDPIVTVDGNGAASEDRKVDGESTVKVTEGARDCKVVENNNEKNDCVDLSNGSAEINCKTTTFDVVEREGESGIIIDGQNGSGSAVVSVDENENDVHVIDNNTVAEGGDEFRTVQNGVSHSEIRDEVVVADSSVKEGVTGDDHEFENVAVGASDVQNDVVAKNEICDGVDADVDQSDRDWEVVAVENGVVKSAEEVEIPVVPVTDVVESVDSNVQGNNEKLESEEIVEKNEFPVDVKECADENSQGGLEKVPVESVSEANEIPNDGENGGKLERSGEGSGHEGENPSDNFVDGDVEASVDRNEIEDDNAVENEAETSKGVVMGEGEVSVDTSEIRNDAVVFEAEPSDNAVESEAHPSVDEAEPSISNDAVESEAHPSVNEAEPSNDAGESEAHPSVNEAEPESSKDADRSEVDPSVSEAGPSISIDTLHSEAHPSVNEAESSISNNAVESEADNSVSEAEPSISNNVVQREADPSVSEDEPSNNAVQSEVDTLVNEVEPSKDADKSEVVPSDSEAEPSNDAVLSNTDLSVSEAEPSNDAVQSEADPSISGAETIKDAVKSEADPSVSEAEPSNDAGDREAHPSVSEAEPEPSKDADESEVDPSVSEAKPSISNDAVHSEAHSSISGAETSNDAVQREADLSVSEAEPSNDAEHSEADPSVDVPKSKTDTVGSEAEPLVEVESSNQADEISKIVQEGSAADTLDGQNTVTEVVKRPFYYLIRVPRYDDSENLKEQIKNALREVEERTKIRDVIRSESQTKKATCKEYGQEVRAAIAEERAARDLLKSKRQEMDSVQSTMNRLNNAISVGDIDSEIRNIEHMIQHETRPLKEEKQLLRQIQQLKQNRDGLSTIMAKQDQSQSLDEKVSIEEKSKQLQLLKKELDLLRNNVQKTEAVTKAAKKKYDEECNQLSEVLARFKEADDTRQEAYVKLHTLKKQLHEKSKYFWEYKNAATKGQELAAQGKREELQNFCIDQAERIMKMWNNNDEFRRDYTRCNTRSTLRRLQTLDGRSLGPDEEPPVIPNAFTERAPKNDSLVSQPTLEQEIKSISTGSINKKDEPVSKVAVQTERSQTAKAKKPAKPTASEKSVVPVARWGDVSDEDTREEPVRTKEEEERILKAEKARKEEEEAKLKEIRRLEEIEKAKEALQRKKRNAEKAQQRAAYKAQKEAEQREKEREKRAKKKEKRKTVSPDDVVDHNTEQESATSTEILTRAAEESDQNEKSVEVTKRPQKPSQYTKQNKVKSLPMSIRNRGKRRIQPWMWILIAVLTVVTLFYMGNNSSLRSSLRSFGF